MNPMTPNEPRVVLQELHRSLAAALQQYLIETPPTKRRASMLGVIRSFLADNSVHVELKPAPGPQTLASDLGAVLDLPFSGDPDDEPFN